MIIPITYKNNDTSSVKTKIGKVSADIARVMNRFTFSQESGILEDEDNECSITLAPTKTASGFVITMNNGWVLVKGGLSFIQSDTTVTAPLTVTTNGSIGVRVYRNATAGNEVELYARDKTYNPLVTSNDAEYYEYELYTYTATDSVLTITGKTAEIVQRNVDAHSVYFVTEEPTSSPEAGKLYIYICSELPATRYSRVIYLVEA